MSAASTLCIVVLLLTVLELPATDSQTISLCGEIMPTPMPVLPFVYNISSVINTMTQAVCPLANNGQDTVLCIQQGPLGALSLTKSIQEVVVCLANQSLCDNLPGDEPYDAVLIQLSSVPTSGLIEISGMINIFVGIVGVRPLEIDSGQTLYVPGGTVILERVFDFVPALVCQILPNGSIIQSPLAVKSISNDNCLDPIGVIPSSVRSLVLSGPMMSVEQSTVTLFLVSNSESCSVTTERLSNNFTINLMINETTPGPPFVTTSDATPIEGLNVQAIGFTVGAAILIVVIVFSLVCACFVRYILRKRKATLIGDGSAEMSRSGSHSTPADIDSKLPPVSLPTNNIDGVPGLDTDSGYQGQSPGPSTPGGNITFVSNLVNSQPLKNELGMAFGVGIKEYQLPSAADQEIEQLIKNIHPSPQVKYVLFVHDLRIEEGSKSFGKLHQHFQTRPCQEFLKVWYWRLGASGNESIDGNIHVRNVTEIGGWNKCAENIHRQISSYTLQHAHPDDNRLATTTSFTPHTFPTHEPLPRSPSTDPVLRRLETIQTQLGDLSETMSNTQRTGEAILEVTQRNQTALHDIKETTTQTKENTEDILQMHENQVSRNHIVGDTHTDPTDS